MARIRFSISLVTEENMKILILAASSIFLIAKGLVCLINPRKIQSQAISSLSRSRVRWFPSKEWIKTSQYIFSIRMGGGLALLMGLICAWALVVVIRGLTIPK
jgi:hypothetical protein